MKILRIIPFLTVISLFVVTNCVVRYPSDLEEYSYWKKLENLERDDLWIRIGDSIYGIDSYDFDDYRWVGAKDVDVATFEVCVGSEGYAKDKRHVYYPLQMTGYDGETWGTYIEDDGYIIEGADPKSFKCLGYGYAVDRFRMYFKGKPIKWDNEILDPKVRERKSKEMYRYHYE